MGEITGKCLVTFILASSTLLSGCASSGQPAEWNGAPTQTIEIPSSTYTSTFPSRDISDKISSVFQSVKRITVTGTYRTYYFNDSLVTVSQIRNGNFRELAYKSINKVESVAGTAVSIAQSNTATVMLTCAHITHAPDTVFEYSTTSDLPGQKYVTSMAIKLSQRNIILDLPRIEEFRVTAVNRADDLALIQFSREADSETEVPPLPVKFGNSKDLKWGSFIYIAGYPKGYPVITRGIVSSPNRGSDGRFLTDALFNQGMSGGIILASRDNFASFEWVGLANAASAEQEYLLVPDPRHRGSDQIIEPYTGTTFVETKTRTVYGLSHSIPTAIIVEFLQQHRALLKNTENNLPNL